MDSPWYFTSTTEKAIVVLQGLLPWLLDKVLEWKLVGTPHQEKLLLAGSAVGVLTILLLAAYWRKKKPKKYTVWIFTILFVFCFSSTYYLALVMGVTVDPEPGWLEFVWVAWSLLYLGVFVSIGGLLSWCNQRFVNRSK